MLCAGLERTRDGGRPPLRPRGTGKAACTAPAIAFAYPRGWPVPSAVPPFGSIRAGR